MNNNAYNYAFLNLLILNETLLKYIKNQIKIFHILNQLFIEMIQSFSVGTICINQPYHIMNIEVLSRNLSKNN